MRLAWFFPAAMAACAQVPASNPGGDEPWGTAADITIGQVDPAAADDGGDAPKGLRALFRSAPEAEPAAADGAADETPDPEAGVAAAEPAEQAPAEVAATSAAPKRGLLGLLAAAPKLETKSEVESPTADAAEAKPAVDETEEVRTAAAAPPSSLFGGSRAKEDKVAPGSVLPFGQVARVCSVGKRALGKEVDRNGKWRLYDTIPNSSAPRVMYITGFDDRCARMFTAALALFGSATAHEAVRYSLRGTYTETDEAYEKIKGRICGVRRGVACPSDRLDRLENQVTYVTAYPSFGGSGPWLDILLHKGDLVAAGLNDR